MGLIVQYTKTGEAHGLVGVLTNSNQFDDFKNINPKIKEKCIKEKKEDARKVKVKYINMKGTNERLTRPYCRWSGDPIELYNLIPNHVYELPMGFINEINNKKTIKRSGLCSEEGTDINPLGAPMEEDKEGDPIHMLVPATF